MMGMGNAYVLVELEKDDVWRVSLGSCASRVQYLCVCDMPYWEPYGPVVRAH